MKVQVMELSSFEREVEVELPADKVRHGIDHALKSLKKRVKVPGFRKGKVPRGVLIKRYGDYIDNHAAEHLVEETFGEALARHGLVPVNEPVLDRGDVLDGRSFKYSLRFEIMPKVEISDYAGVRFESTSADVSDEAVQDELARLQEARSTFQAVERESQDDDRVTFKIEGTIDDEDLKTRGETDQAILGQDGLIEPLEEGMKGVKSGTTVEIDHTFADDHEGTMAGRTLKATVEVIDVEERITPKLDDEFAKDQDFDDLDALRSDVRDRLQKSAEAEAKRENEGALLKAILEKNDFEIPPALVRDRTDAQLRSATQMFANAGVDPRSLGDPKELRDRTQERVIFDTRKQVIIDSVARQEKIEVSDDDVEAKIVELAEESKQPLPKVRARYAQGEGRSHLEHMLKAERVLDFLLSRANIQPGSDD